MKRNVYHSGNISNKNPDWYWTNGLHDAKIVSVECLQSQCDYKTKNPIRNSMKLFINSAHALYDTTIDSITLINYKIMTPDIELENCHWLEDVLDFDNGKYILNITVTDCRNNYVFTVKFDYAEIVRLN